MSLEKSSALIVVARSPMDGISLAYLERVAGELEHRGFCDRVRPAYVQADPPLELTVASLLDEGVHRVFVLPLMFEMDSATHRLFKAVLEGLNDTKCELLPPIGFDSRLAAAVEERIELALSGVDATLDVPILSIEGRVRSKRSFTFLDLRSLPTQVPDVSRVVPGRHGSGVRIQALLGSLDLLPEARRVIFESKEDRFSTTVDLEEAKEKAILVYRLEDFPLPEKLGGPLRLLIPNTDDKCVNVKSVVHMEVV